MSVSFGVLSLIVTAAASNAPADNGTTALRIVWDLHVSPETEHVTRWLAQRGWCWAIETPPYASNDLVLPLREQGFVVIGQIHAHPKTRAWHWTLHNQDVPDIDAVVALLREANAEAPRVSFFMEDDSAGVGFSEAFLRNPPATHAEANAMFDAYLETAMAEARRFPDARVWATAGFAGTAHHYARHGAQCVIVERANDDVEDLQTAVAFARGAARQFDCAWGIDLSLWWGVIYGCVQDLPASLYTRHLWLSYINGAQVYRIEGGNLLVRPDGPTAVANAIDEFASIAHTFHPGKPDTPLAVMLPRDHGWMTPAYWRTTNEAWNYARLPYRQGERGIDGFFGAAYPGSVYAQDPFPAGAYESDDPPASPFSLSCITPDFAPTPEQTRTAAPPVPFGAYKNRNDARRDFYENGKDPSPYRPMGDSRWGDIIDVLTDDAPIEVMKQYPLLVLLGPVHITKALRQGLTEYVRAGGALVWAAGVATPEENELVGATIQPELRVGRDWQWRDATPVHEAFRYCPVSIEVESAANVEILARTRSDAPLVLAHRMGKGNVYTCLIPWFEAGHTPLSRLALRLLDAVITPIQPVTLDGPPAAWASSRSNAAIHVVIANHDDASWQGEVVLRNVNETFDLCRDSIRDEPIVFQRNGKDARVALDIEAYGTRVLQWTRTAMTQSE